ncbi:MULTISPECIES: DMT family transporter [Mesorhizobium]|uniref:DMT family transporter n=1 Tax=Mesorhizobium TaxID=68287 RepID=UPI0010A9710C|nr:MULTISPECIES: DMT family transporter [Mesorhizobium]
MLLDSYSKGLLFVTISAVAWSTAGLFVRVLPLDAWTILFWRSLFAAAFLAIHLFVDGPRHSLRPTGRGMIVAASLAIALLAFIPACQLTSIANVAVLYGTTPIFTAILGWLWLGETIRPATMLAIVTMSAGTGVLVWGTSLDSEFVGNALAVAMTFMTAFVAVCIRRYREESLLASICAANVFVSLVSSCFTAPLLPSLRHLVYLALFGLVQVGLAFVFYSAGARRVPASQASLIGALETPLAPFWVWLAFGETPSLSTLVGGGIITASTVGYLLGMARLAARRSADGRLSQELQEGVKKGAKLNG